MLRILREHASSWMLRGILILVAVTFISWGGYSLMREKRQTYAANVNGTIIETKDFRETYENVIKQYQEALGPSFSEKMIAELHLSEKVLNDLISRVLILQEGARLGIDIHNEELREAIESIPYFQVNGQFDSRLYERFLRLNHMTADEFERIQRESLLLSKVANLIKLNGGKVSEDETLETYLFENERINLTFLKVTPDEFKGKTTANQVEIQDYFQKRQEEFRTPVFLQIQYLAFRPSEFEKNIQIPSDEIKRYYDLHKERFKIPKKVKAKELLIKVNPDDQLNKIEEKRKRAEEILEKAKKMKDFGALAKQYSDSNTAPMGGDLGWVQEGTVDELIERPLFSTKPGELSEVVKGRNGFYIFKIEDLVNEKQRPLEEVKNQILETIKKEKAKQEAANRADDAFYSLFRSRDLERYAREKNLSIKTTGFFKEGDEIPEVGRNPSFYSSASSLKVGEISSVLSLPPVFYLLKLLDKRDSRIPPLEEVKEEVRRKVIDMKCEEKARQMAEDLLNQIREGKTMKEAAQAHRIQMEETGLFTRAGGMLPKIGPVGEFMTELSSLTEKNPFPKQVLKIKNIFFILKLSDQQPADQSKLSSLKDNLQKRLLYQKQEEFFENWLKQLRAKAKITINKDIL